MTCFRNEGLEYLSAIMPYTTLSGSLPYMNANVTLSRGLNRLIGQTVLSITSSLMPYTFPYEYHVKACHYGSLRCRCSVEKLEDSLPGLGKPASVVMLIMVAVSVE